MYVGVDVLYAYLKESDWLKESAEKILKKKVKTSVITIVEVEIVAKRDFGDEFANSVFERLKELKSLEIVSLEPKILEKAVEFRINFGLNIFDSLHAASAFVLDEEIVSSDRVYDIVEGIERIDPREF